MSLVGRFILPALALLIVVLIAYVGLRWVAGDPDRMGESTRTEVTRKGKRDRFGSRTTRR
jgi:hypothetical protein